MLKYMKKYWIIAFFAAVFMVCEVGVDLIQPRMMEKIVDEGILGLNNNGIPDMDLVIHTGIKMVLVVICGGLAGISCGAFTNIFSQNLRQMKCGRMRSQESCPFPLNRRMTSPQVL